MGWAKIKSLYFCGTVHEYSRKVCPADGKTCNKFKTPNHFATVCKQNLYASNIGPYKNKPNKYGRPNKYGKRVKSDRPQQKGRPQWWNRLWNWLSKIETVNLTESRVGLSDKDILNIKKQRITELLFVSKHKAHSIKCQVDTGASCNIVLKNDLLRLTKNRVT